MCTFLLQSGLRPRYSIANFLQNTHIWLTHPWSSYIRYVKLRVVHALGMPGTFSPPPRVSDPDMHHGTCVTCGSLISGSLWSRWWGKRSWHSRRMRNPQFYVSGKRPMMASYGVSREVWPIVHPLRLRASIHWSVRRLNVKSREVSKPRD